MDSTGRTCLFRVDAGEKWGGGHFYRCLSLARAMQNKGFSVTFVMAAVPDAFKKIAQALQLQMVVYPHEVDPGSSEDLTLFRQCPLEKRYDWVVFDGYHYNRFYRESVGCCAKQTFIIQDVPGDYADAAIFLDQNVNIEVEEYIFSAECQVLLGPVYSLTSGDSEFRNERIKLHNDQLRVLITLGGADVKKISLPVARALKGLDAHLDIVLGSESGWHPSDFNCLNGSVTIHNSPDGIDNLIARSDLGIMSLGITTWEMCFYGLPFVMLASNPNQKRVIEWFQKKDLADDGLKEGHLQADYFYSRVDRLLNDASKRQQRSQRLMEIIDGRGPERVAQMLVRKP